ncbi:hypothetical protein PLESTB_001446900 [Pleodorina starrii]|uniref:Uncharacterized protein n=1 Tax=Pleodorina starrii TaxID=330485 RepID=A0A9W6BWE3_9CHLO|nr:hypothetical protein PLESTB_001446900 [Pleodorina starrii]
MPGVMAAKPSVSPGAVASSSLHEAQPQPAAQNSSQQAVQPQPTSGAPAAVAATVAAEPAMQHRAANGVKCYVCGDPQGPFSSITDMPPECNQRLLAANAEAWNFFGSDCDPHMYYCTEGQYRSGRQATAAAAC